MKSASLLAAALLASTALTGALAGALTSAASAQVVVQWQTPNLTEAQYEPIWKKTIAAFEAANPGVKIEPIPIARKDHWTKFVAAAQARQAPCVVAVDVATAADAGYLRPLDDFWAKEPASFRDAWSEDMLKSTRWKGKLYGLPNWGGVYAEVYNTEMVVKAGLDPKNPPKTWAEYVAWAKKLTGPDQWATAVLGGKTDTTTRVLLTWIYGNGGDPFNADMTESRFARDPKSLEAIKAYLGLFANEKVAAPAPTTTNYLEQTVLFAQGKIATMRNAYWSLAKVIGDNPKMAGKMFVAPMPAQIPNAPTLATVSAHSISSSCAHPEMAWKFATFDMGKEWAIQRATMANWMPLRRDLATEPQIQADPILAQFVQIGTNAKSYPLAHPAWADIAANDVVDAVQKALLDPAKTEEIFKDLDVRLTRKLKDS